MKKIIHFIWVLYKIQIGRSSSTLRLELVSWIRDWILWSWHWWCPPTRWYRNWKPVTFCSRKMSSTELNYEIWNKEILAILQIFEEWRPELEGHQNPLQVITNRKVLEYFMKSCLLSCIKARWNKLLSHFDLKLCCHPGDQYALADTLSLSIRKITSRNKSLQQSVLKPYNLSPEMDENNLISSRLNIKNKSHEK